MDYGIIILLLNNFKIMLDPNIEPGVPTTPEPNMTPPIGTPMPSPASAPTQGTTPQEGNLSQDQMKANLQELMSKINDKYQDFSKNNFASSFSTQKQKNEQLRAIFDFFQEAGIDPSDTQAVGDFLNNLKTSSPELYQQLISVLQSVMGEDNSTQPTTSPVPPQEATPTPPNMNINTNEPPQQNI